MNLSNVFNQCFDFLGIVSLIVGYAPCTFIAVAGAETTAIRHLSAKINEIQAAISLINRARLNQAVK